MRAHGRLPAPRSEEGKIGLMAGLTAKASGGIEVSLSNPVVIDLGHRWISRTLAVGIAKQARSNLLKGLDPDGKPMPPLKGQDILNARTTERYSKLRGKRKTLIRGVVTGELMRSIVSASTGVSAEVFIQGERGRSVNGDVPASVSVFAQDGDSIFRVTNLEQKYIKEAINKIAQRVVDQKVKVEMEDVMGMLH